MSSPRSLWWQEIEPPLAGTDDNREPWAFYRSQLSIDPKDTPELPNSRGSKRQAAAVELDRASDVILVAAQIAAGVDALERLVDLGKSATAEHPHFTKSRAVRSCADSVNPSNRRHPRNSCCHAIPFLFIPASHTIAATISFP